MSPGTAADRTRWRDRGLSIVWRHWQSLVTAVRVAIAGVVVATAGVAASFLGPLAFATVGASRASAGAVFGTFSLLALGGAGLILWRTHLRVSAYEKASWRNDQLLDASLADDDTLTVATVHRDELERVAAKKLGFLTHATPALLLCGVSGALALVPGAALGAYWLLPAAAMITALFLPAVRHNLIAIGRADTVLEALRNGRVREPR